MFKEPKISLISVSCTIWFTFKLCKKYYRLNCISAVPRCATVQCIYLIITFFKMYYLIARLISDVDNPTKRNGIVFMVVKCVFLILTYPSSATLCVLQPPPIHSKISTSRIINYNK